jgi:hypothetical protein
MGVLEKSAGFHSANFVLHLLFSTPRPLYGVDNPTSHEEAPTMTCTVSSRPTFLADLPGI